MLVNAHQIRVDFASPQEPFFAWQVFSAEPGSGMSRAQYYWRQADICLRLSLLSDDSEVAELLINKAMELMSQAETAAVEGDADAVGERLPYLPTASRMTSPDESA